MISSENGHAWVSGVPGLRGNIRGIEDSESFKIDLRSICGPLPRMSRCELALSLPPFLCLVARSWLGCAAIRTCSVPERSGECCDN